MIPCDRTFGGETCGKVGDHRCVQRGDHIVAFFAKKLVHTKGSYAKKPFILAEWQEHDIIRPVFETVKWSEEVGLYVRRYRIMWFEVARKLSKEKARS